MENQNLFLFFEQIYLFLPIYINVNSNCNFCLFAIIAPFIFERVPALAKTIRILIVC